MAVTLVNGRLEVRHQLHGAQGWFKNLMGTVNNNSSNSAVISIAAARRRRGGGRHRQRRRPGLRRSAATPGSTPSPAPSWPTARPASSHVNTVSGEVIARNHDGVLTAKSVSGEVTASGGFSNIRANTVSGDLSFDLHGFTHDFGANSVSGDVTIRLPHDVGVDIVAKSASGAVVIDDQKYPQPGGNVQTIAGPDAQLMLVRTNSVSGKTSIFHGQPAHETPKQAALMPPVFAHGALRLYLLALLESGPKHGYELIKALSERFGGTYSPSAGTIYPRLGKLEEEGLVATETEGRRTNYSITPAGLAELNSRRDELAGVENDISASVRRLADNLRADIRANMRGLRADLAATAEAARSTARSADFRNGWHPAALRRGPRLQEAEMLVQAFRDDIRVELRLQASRHPLSPVTLETVKTVLDQARISIRNSLEG